MITRHKIGTITWIDLESPSKNEVQAVAKEFGIHRLVADELLVPSERAKVESIGKYIYLILHFPTCNEALGICEEQEVDFVIGKKFIITTHYSGIKPLAQFATRLEVSTMLNKRKMTHSGFLFYYLMLDMYIELNRELRHIGYRLGEIEDEIFTGKEREMVLSLSLASRSIIDFKRAVRHHEDILESYSVIAQDLFNNHYNYYTEDLMGEYRKVANQLETHRETLVELRDTNDSLVSTKMNEIMKNLTIMAFVTFPLSLLAAVFGMNTVHIPLAGHPYDFWIVVGIMAIGVTYMYAYFKHKRWL